jgi:hypothetical protein
MVLFAMAEPHQSARGIPYLRASLADLHASPAPETCDACGGELPHRDDDEEGYALRGKGVYLSCRGDQVRYEDVPLCPSCGSAIGLSALRQWEIEEEEG